MAQEGYEGPVEVIEGKEGLDRSAQQRRVAPRRTDSRDLGRTFLITDCSYKAFPTEALTHQPISAALNICQEHGLSAGGDRRDKGGDHHPRSGHPLRPVQVQPETRETADHSLPYVVAAALADGSVLPSSFSEEKLKDPVIWDLLGKIEVVADPEIDSLFPGLKRARVTIRTVGGASYTSVTDYARGAPENPLSDNELIAKFRANAEGVLTREQQDRAIEATLDFENVTDLGAYLRLFVR